MDQTVSINSTFFRENTNFFDDQKYCENAKKIHCIVFPKNETKVPKISMYRSRFVIYGNACKV